MEEGNGIDPSTVIHGWHSFQDYLTGHCRYPPSIIARFLRIHVLSVDLSSPNTPSLSFILSAANSRVPHKHFTSTTKATIIQCSVPIVNLFLLLLRKNHKQHSCRCLHVSYYTRFFLNVNNYFQQSY